MPSDNKLVSITSMALSKKLNANNEIILPYNDRDSNILDGKEPLLAGYTANREFKEYGANPEKINKTEVYWIYAGAGDGARKFAQENHFRYNTNIEISNDSIYTFLLKGRSMCKIYVNDIALDHDCLVRCEIIKNKKVEVYRGELFIDGIFYPRRSILLMKHHQDDLLKLRFFHGADKDFLHVGKYGENNEYPVINKTHHTPSSIVGVLHSIYK